MKKTRTVVSNLVVLSAVLIVSIPAVTCSRSGKSEAGDGDIQTLSSLDDLKKTIDKAGDKLLVFDLYADWCMPCKVLAPTFSALATDHKEKATFYRINVDKSPDIAAAFGVRGIPYVVFVKNKEAVYALTGLNPRESYEKVITSCGAQQSASSCQKQLESL